MTWETQGFTTYFKKMVKNQGFILSMTLLVKVLPSFECPACFSMGFTWVSKGSMFDL